MHKETLKSDCHDKDDSGIATDVLEEFCNAILDNPQLYPYFMKLRPNGLWEKCNKMACFISFVSNKNIITPADTEFLKKIHHGLNINETSYDEFTRLFVHICCRKKSNFRRKKMSSIFSLLKAHICPASGNGEIFGAFCEVISHLNPVDWKEEGDKKRGSSLLDRFPEPSHNSMFRSSDKISNELAQYFHYRKRLRKCERLVTVIKEKSRRMEMRIAKLEKKGKKDQKLKKQQRNLDIIYN